MKFMHTALARSLAACLVFVAAGGAQAQSGYTLTTLSPPTSGMVPTSSGYMGHGFGIDSADQVVASASYYAGYYFDTNAPHIRKRYDPYIVRWPVSTAAAVMPTKLIKAPEWTFLDLIVSYDAKKVLMYSKGMAVFDVATLKLGPTMPSIYDGVSVNNAGVVAWNAKDYSGTHGIWSATGGSVVLSSAPDTGIGVGAINGSGTLVGSVQKQTDQLGRAAMWVNGQMTVLDQRPGVGSAAIAISETGKVVARSFLPYCHGLVNCDSYNDVEGVLENGVFTPIAGPAGPVPYQVRTQAISSGGLVVGYINTVSGRDVPADRRGFMWRDNTLIDMTEYLLAKGVALPAGAVITNVLAINDKGSMVAAMKNSKGVISLIRLAAKP